MFNSSRPARGAAKGRFIVVVVVRGRAGVRSWTNGFRFEPISLARGLTEGMLFTQSCLRLVFKPIFADELLLSSLPISGET